MRDKIINLREYFFRDLHKQVIEKIEMDEEVSPAPALMQYTRGQQLTFGQAAYSVTEMGFAEESTQLILRTLGLSDPAQATITDATACGEFSPFAFGF